MIEKRRFPATEKARDDRNWKAMFGGIHFLRWGNGCSGHSGLARMATGWLI